MQTLDDIVTHQLSTPSQSTTLLSGFALLSLLLASLGLHGVLSYSVTQRTNEIGVRMAMGATSGNILLLIGQRGLRLTLSGLAIGLGLSAASARLNGVASLRFRARLCPGLRRDLGDSSPGLGLRLPDPGETRITNRSHPGPAVRVAAGLSAAPCAGCEGGRPVCGRARRNRSSFLRLSLQRFHAIDDER